MSLRVFSLTFASLLCFFSAIAAQTSGSLPVMYINTEGAKPVTSKDSYITGSYYIDNMGLADFEGIGDADNPLPLQIRGRGNYTWSAFEKKPYRLKLDKKADLLGLGANKHFALLAHADDNYGFLRNPVGFYLSRTLGMPWTPGEQPVELVLNGSYAGLYFLTETIRVDKDRVDVTEQPDLATSPEIITGGWLVEIDNYYDDPHILIKEGDGADIVITYKSPEALSPEQTAFLTSQMQRINDDVYSSDHQVCRWAELVDIPTLARFYVVQEIMDNYESFHGSCYMWRQRGDGEKWMFGPVWDFGSAFNYDKSQYVYQGREHHMTWIGHMCLFPEFMDAVRAVWQDFCSHHYNEMLEYVQAYADRIAEAAAADARRWPKYGNADEQEKAALVISRLRKSCRWLVAQWGGTLDDPAIQPVTLYYINDAPSPWDRVYAYSWDNGPDGFYELFGRWPGSEMWRSTINGTDVYTITAMPTHELSARPGLIFDNGHSGTGNQTADLVLHNGHIYHYDGTHQSSLGCISGTALDITTDGRKLTITTDAPRALTLTTIDGRTTTLHLDSGTNTCALPPGFYILPGVGTVRVK